MVATWTNNLITGTTCYGHNAIDSDPMITRAGRSRTRKNELMPPPCKIEKNPKERTRHASLPGRILAPLSGCSRRGNALTCPRTGLVDLATITPRTFFHTAREERVALLAICVARILMPVTNVNPFVFFLPYTTDLVSYAVANGTHKVHLTSQHFLISGSVSERMQERGRLVPHVIAKIKKKTLLLYKLFIAVSA